MESYVQNTSNRELANNINLKHEDEKRIARMFVAFFSYNLVTLLINFAVNFILPNTPVDTVICTSILVVFVLFAIGPIMRNIGVLDIIFVFICISVYLINIVVHYENYEAQMEQLPSFLFTVLPLYFLGKGIKNFKLVLEYLEKTSKVLIFGAFAYYMILILNEMEMLKDDMSFAYYLLPFVIIRFYSLLNSFSVWNLIYFAVGVSTMFLSGTRGPFLCLVVSIILFVWFSTRKQGMKLFWIVLLTGLVIFFLSDAFVTVLESINKFLIENNIENRIVEKLLDEEIWDGSGRETILVEVKNAIKQNPILGSGLCSDITKFGTYAHNFFYELLLHFGYIVGLGIFVVVTVQCLRAISVKESSYRVIAILCICCSYVKLFVSNSYLQEPFFFLMLGVIFSKNFIPEVDCNYVKETDEKTHN